MQGLRQRHAWKVRKLHGKERVTLHWLQQVVGTDSPTPHVQKKLQQGLVNHFHTLPLTACTYRPGKLAWRFLRRAAMSQVQCSLRPEATGVRLLFAQAGAREQYRTPKKLKTKAKKPGLLLRNLTNYITIIPKPCYLLYIHIMVT